MMLSKSEYNLALLSLIEEKERDTLLAFSALSPEEIRGLCPQQLHKLLCRLFGAGDVASLKKEFYSFNRPPPHNMKNCEKKRFSHFRSVSKRTLFAISI